MSLSQGVYWIRNSRWTNKVLDLKEAKTENGTRILNFDQHDTLNQVLNQLWLLERVETRDTYLIRSVHSNLVLDLHDGLSANGTPVQAWTEHGGRNQQWRVEYSKSQNDMTLFRIVNAASGTALSHNEDDSDTSTVAWSIDDGPKQLWAFTPFVPSLSVRLRVKQTGRVLDLKEASAANGTPALAWNEHTAVTKRNQLWWLPKLQNSEGYTIQCLETNTVADLAYGKSDNGTPIIGWQSHGGRNQQWDIELYRGDYQRIKNIQGGTAMDAFADSKEKKVGGWQFHGGDNQQWLLDPVPSPAPTYVLLQNAGTNKFLASNDSNDIDTVDGPQTVFDGRVQWRFVQTESTGIYTIVNRATGRKLRQVHSSIPSIGLVDSKQPDNKDCWVLESYKKAPGVGLISIVNRATGFTLDHYAGVSVQALDIGMDNQNRTWKVLQANDWFPSFALVNGQSGTALTDQAGKHGHYSSTENINQYDAQWVIHRVHDGPQYVIQNKASNHCIGGASARWELVPRNEKYFGIRNVSTKKYIGIHNNQVTFNDQEMSDKCQAFELVSGRTPDNNNDFLYMDDDVLEVIVPLMGEQGAELGQRIDRRRGRQPPKDVSEWGRVAPNRFNPPDNVTVRQLVSNLIDRLDIDIANEESQPVDTLVKCDQNEAERVIGQRLPQSIRDIFGTSGHPDRVFRIERQGCVDVGGGRYVNILGLYEKDVYCHVVLPVGVRYGKEVVRSFLRESMDRSTTVVVTRASSKAPNGGPNLKPDAQAASENLWIKYAQNLLPIVPVKHSEL